MKKLTMILFLLIFPWISVVSQEKISEVLIISTIHGAHKVNPKYSYDSLFKFIDKFNPDVIGVEVRNEDIAASVSYLKNNYPYEMYHCVEKYSTKKVLGIDWLGADLEGRAVPENYWKDNSAIKKLQQKINLDTLLIKELSILDVIKEEKNKLALKASLAELNDGRYDVINHIYYTQLKTLFQDTEYMALSDFYQQRDEHIARNIVEIIKNNRGKRMIFLVGADHRDFALKMVSKELGNGILLNPESIVN